MAAELRPGQLLDQFFQRADAAGQRDEGVGALEHDALALVHVGRDDHLVGAFERQFARLQEFRNDADDLAAVVMDGPGERAHQAVGAAAIDEADAVPRQQPAKRRGGAEEGRIGAGA